MTARVIATIFALVSFAAALIVGQHAGNPLPTILLRAILVMLVCYMIGRVIGAVAQSSIKSHIERYRAEHPIPDHFSTDDEFGSSGGSANDSPPVTSQPASVG